jgi:hypothetical protein
VDSVSSRQEGGEEKKKNDSRLAFGRSWLCSSCGSPSRLDSALAGCNESTPGIRCDDSDLNEQNQPRRQRSVLSNPANHIKYCFHATYRLARSIFRCREYPRHPEYHGMSLQPYSSFDATMDVPVDGHRGLERVRAHSCYDRGCC